MGAGRRKRVKGRIRLQEAQYIQVILEGGGPLAKKQALQRLCSLLRQGYILEAPRTMKGLILQSLWDDDEKVRRWAFNALAQLGEVADINLIMTALEKSRENPEVFEAGLSAIGHILPKDQLTLVLSQWGLSMTPAVILALAQQSEAFDGELSRVHLDIDGSKPPELKSAALMVGLQKAPSTLFSKYHPVTDVLGHLNMHDDPIVAQYSFWAIAEHPALGLEHAKVPISQFRTLLPNVQGWALRVLTKDDKASAKHFDLIQECSESDEREIRDGLAGGLRGLFYDSLDTVVIDWFYDERDGDISDRLLEHMCAQSARAGSYIHPALEAFRDSSPGSLRRAKMEAACENEALFLEFRKIQLQTGEPDLFASIKGGTVNNNTMNINAQNVAGVSNSGTGNEGAIQQLSVAQAQERLAGILEPLEKRLGAMSDKAAEEGRSLVADVKSKPTKSKLETLVNWLKLAKGGSEALAGIGHSADGLLADLHHILPHLPLG